MLRIIHFHTSRPSLTQARQKTCLKESCFGILTACLFFSLVSTSFAKTPKPKPTDLFQAQLLQAAQHFSQLIGQGTVAITNTRPATDVEESLKTQAGFTTIVTQGSLLKVGVRAILIEKDRPLKPKYLKNRLKRGPQFTMEDALFMRDKKQVDFILQSRLAYTSKQYTIIWELFNVKTQRPVDNIRFPKFRDTELLKTASKWSYLPNSNICLLKFAKENIGKQIGRGECWDLPAVWLRQNGFVVKGYDFGTEVSIAESMPGDVLTIDANGHHHVMLLAIPKPNLKGAKIYHQNTSGRRFVVEDTFPMSMRNGIKVWRPNVRKQ